MTNNHAINTRDVFVYTIVDVVTNYQGGTSYRLLYLPYPDTGQDKYAAIAASALDAERMGIPFCIELTDNQLPFTTGLGATIRAWFVRSMPSGYLYPIRFQQMQP